MYLVAVNIVPHGSLSHTICEFDNPGAILEVTATVYERLVRDQMDDQMLLALWKASGIRSKFATSGNVWPRSMEDVEAIDTIDVEEVNRLVQTMKLVPKKQPVGMVTGIHQVGLPLFMDESIGGILYACMVYEDSYTIEELYDIVNDISDTDTS